MLKILARRSHSFTMACLRACLVLMFFPAATPATSAQVAATVTLAAGQTGLTVPTTAVGVNTAAWDAGFNDSLLPSLIAAAGVKMLRYPGGSVADYFHWQTTTATPNIGNPYVNGADTFDKFMGIASAAGSGAIITVNYGSNAAGTGGGDPNEAAAWVNYANNTKKYGVKYWEIGNELYGNGEYGSGWETDLHTSKTPTTYGQNVLLFASAMKAQDPTIKVGAVLTAPGNWPDSQTPNWNTNVLAQCGASIDFVIVHWYPQGPGNESDSGLLADTSQISGMVSKVQTLINTYCGANAANVQIFVTETNSVSYNPGKQTVSLVNALFLADNTLTWLEDGAMNVDWWDLHNGGNTSNNNSPSLYGTATYGDYGILAAGGSPEPAAETPFPPYFALQMLQYIATSGGVVVSGTSNASLLVEHGVLQSNGNLALLLINEDPSNSYSTSVSITGYTPVSTATEYFYGMSSSAITSSPFAAGTSYSLTVPAYSLTTVVMTPAPVSISGTILLQACASNAQPLTLIFSPTGSTQGSIFTRTITPAASGAFTVGNVPYGTYTVAFHGAKWLRKNLAMDCTHGSLTGVTAALLGGDVNGDNQITAADLALAKIAYGSSSTSANWNVNADVNCDGQVSMIDLAIIRANMGKLGDQLPAKPAKKVKAPARHIPTK